MAVTVDCGEGKHALCVGEGHTAYLIPQASRSYDEPPFPCRCRCHGEAVARNETAALSDPSASDAPTIGAPDAIRPESPELA